jgi:hypothetical protein
MNRDFSHARFMPFSEYVRKGLKERAVQTIRAHNIQMQRRRTDAADAAAAPLLAATSIERVVSGNEANDLRARCEYTVAKESLLTCLRAGFFPPGSCRACGR